MISIAENRDCLEAMRNFPDKFFDLAIVDPPYGSADGAVERTGGKWAAQYGSKIKQWDNAPDQDYFKELFRVSQNQIIWGANYFTLPPTRCFVVWRKANIPEGFTMAMAEYAWTSFDRNALVYEGYSNMQDYRIHPTQKPVELYTFLIRYFSNHGYKILDTHLGSGSSRIAAYDAGLDFWGYEIDKEYFQKQEERFKKHISQISILENEENDNQLS